MNTPTNTNQCCGLFGKIFGHSFKSVFETTETLTPPDKELTSVSVQAIKDINQNALASYREERSYDTTDYIAGTHDTSIENITRLNEVNSNETTKYKGEVCCRCGKRVNVE